MKLPTFLILFILGLTPLRSAPRNIALVITDNQNWFDLGCYGNKVVKTPEMDRLARGGRSDAFEFPRPLIHEANDDFSFSGLKTSVRYFLDRNPKVHETEQGVRDVCASVQEAIVDVLAAKLLRAARREGAGTVTVSGGVSCNSRLRAVLEERCAKRQVELRIAAGAYSTDNAAMIGMLAEEKLRRGEFTLEDFRNFCSRYHSFFGRFTL